MTQFDQPLKDSGERATFTTGAVRDHAKGKGRMDLLPPAPLYQLSLPPEDLFIPQNVPYGATAAQVLLLDFMIDFKPNKLMAALRNLMFQIECDLGKSPDKFTTYTLDEFPSAILEVAKHFEKGALKYEARNWEKGINLSRFWDSAYRHLMQYLRGDVDEPHLVATAWNVACMYQTGVWIQAGVLPATLYDLPSRGHGFPVESLLPKLGPISVRSRNPLFDDTAKVLTEVMNSLLYGVNPSPHLPNLTPVSDGHSNPEANSNFFEELKVLDDILEATNKTTEVNDDRDFSALIEAYQNGYDDALVAGSGYETGWDDGRTDLLEGTINPSILLTPEQCASYEISDKEKAATTIGQVLWILAHVKPHATSPLKALLDIGHDFAEKENRIKKLEAHIQQGVDLFPSPEETQVAEVISEKFPHIFTGSNATFSTHPE